MNRFFQKKTKQLVGSKSLVNERNHKSNKEHHKPINTILNKMLKNNLHSKVKMICQNINSNKEKAALH